MQAQAPQQPAALQQDWSQQYAQAPGYGQPGPGGQDELKTLWIGDLLYWMDENYLWNGMAHSGELQSVKVIRNKSTGQSEGYGFMEFMTHAGAERALSTFNGHPMPQAEQQAYRLNWASFGINERRPEPGPEHSIFVGDLANDVTDYLLNETFRSRYPSVRGAKVVSDNVTGRSKGYGFVRFGLEEERDRALSEMNGELCCNRPMRISVATPKKPLIPPAGGYGGGGPGMGGLHPGAYQESPGDSDPSNTTIFVGGLDPTISDDQLRASFAPFGELVYVKIPYGKGCGFVQYMARGSAEQALQQLHGTVIGNQAVRLSWGRNPAAKQRHQNAWGAPDSSAWPQQQQQQGYYGYSPGYDQGGYGYAQDPNAYYGGYAPQPQPQGYVGYQQPHGGHTPSSAPPSERRENEVFDPTAPINVDKMNAAYVAAHDQAMGQNMWLKSPSDSSVTA